MGNSSAALTALPASSLPPAPATPSFPRCLPPCVPCTRLPAPDPSRLREPIAGRGRAAGSERAAERGSLSGRSSSLCEVTEGLPGRSPAFSLESAGLRRRKEPALFTTWPEPSPAPSLPGHRLGGAGRPGLPLWGTTPTPPLWPSQLGLRPRPQDPRGHQEDQPLRAPDLLPAHAAGNPDLAALPPRECHQHPRHSSGTYPGRHEGCVSFTLASWLSRRPQSWAGRTLGFFLFPSSLSPSRTSPVRET